MVSYKKASFYEFSKYKNRNVIYLNAVKRPYVRNAGRGHCPRPGLSREWRHNENTAGLGAAGTGRRYDDWRQARVASRVG